MPRPTFTALAAAVLVGSWGYLAVTFIEAVVTGPVVVVPFPPFFGMREMDSPRALPAPGPVRVDRGPAGPSCTDLLTVVDVGEVVGLHPLPHRVGAGQCRWDFPEFYDTKSHIPASATLTTGALARALIRRERLSAPRVISTAAGRFATVQVTVPDGTRMPGSPVPADRTRAFSLIYTYPVPSPSPGAYEHAVTVARDLAIAYTVRQAAAAGPT